MKRFELVFLALQLPVDFFMLAAAAVSAYFLRFTDWAVAIRPVMFDLTLDQFLGKIFWVIIGWMIIFALSGLYRLDPNRRFAQDIIRIVLGCSAGLAAIAVYLLFTQTAFDSRFLVATGWGLSILLVVFGRLVIRGLKGVLYRAGMGLRRVVLIGNDEITAALQETFIQRPELGYRVAGTYDRFTEKTAHELEKQKAIDEIILTNPRTDERAALAALDFANSHHIGFKYSADLFATLTANMQVHPVGGIPLVELKRTRLEGWGRIVKRTFDVFFSVCALVLFSPIYIIVALLVLIETGRPIIYQNERVGVRGRHFTTLKFRSMYQKDSTGAQFGSSGEKALQKEAQLIKKQNSKSGPIYKVANDPRVTPLGRFLRRWSIDELPQFWNVLRGDMSIVGPRPHQPREVAGYNKQHLLVFSLKPGITGLSQISGRSDLSFEEEMRLDALYIERWSLLLDLIIVLKTPFILCKKRQVV